MSAKESIENFKHKSNELELILSSLDTGLSVINSDHTISWVNKKTYEMFPGADPIGKICHRFYESSDEPCEPCPTLQCFKSGRVHELEKYNPTKERWYRIISQPLKYSDGQVVSVLEGVTDITERKEEGKKIQQERSFLKKLLETSPVGITVVNQDGQISQANAFAEKTLGLMRSDIYNRRYNDSDWRITDFEGNVYPDEDLPFHQVKRTGEPVYGVKHATEWPDGKRVLLSINAAPLFDNNGSFSGMVSVIEDVTEREQAEEEKDRLVLELKRALSEVKTLSGLLPICSHCKKIRDDKGYWNQIETYIRDHSDAEFSHSICQECAKKYYPGMDIYDDEQNQE